MNHKGTVTMETSRLILRKATTDDIEAAFANWMSDEKTTEFLIWSAHKEISTTEESLKGWISRYENLNYYRWVIVLKEINEPIGTISGGSINERTETIDVGYCIGSKWWHQGFASEALAAILPFFFEKVKVQRIQARHDPNNPNSGRVVKKCGLIYEGTLRKADWNNKGIVDACVYGMLISDYYRLPQYRP